MLCVPNKCIIFIMIEKRRYIRDGRSPIPKNPITSRIMSAIRAKHTQPEKALRKALNQIGLNDYKLHLKGLPGKPDIGFLKKRVAIFVNGCYWHRCPFCKPALPKSHRSFWQKKFIKNRMRDKQKLALIKKLGWKTKVVWECQLKKNPAYVANQIAKLMRGYK